VDTGLDQDKTELGVGILAVTLKVLFVSKNNNMKKKPVS
jgi:hypothetical protein